MDTLIFFLMLGKVLLVFHHWELCLLRVCHIWPLLCWGSFCLWRGQWHPTPVLLPGKSHGRRSLEGCSPWGCWGSDTTEQLHFHFSLSCIGEGNGNPLQCSCLENPRDGGAWWAAVYGVTQSRTQMKWLSSSSFCLCPFFWSFYHKCVLKYVKSFFHIYLDYQMVFIFQITYIVCYIDWFAFIRILASLE